MTRAARQDNSNVVSLFPFLAVLLCTMGALVVVLVGVARLSRDQAVERVAQQRREAAPLPVPTNDRRAQLGQVKQYIAHLERVRAEAEQQLHDDHERLTHLEDHLRRLQDQGTSLGMAALELDALDEDHQHDCHQAEQELKRLERLIADAREVIDELKQQAASQSRSYAIVPYVGSHGTRRPPVNIECRKDAVILQPENIRLTEEDFREPLGPGNPLASALRAARDHLVRQNPEARFTAETEPYPLIIVRPDGIGAYYKVREAIESWDSDFGYELVDGDWELEYLPANPELAAVEYQAIEQARERLRMLAVAAPRAYGGVASAGGGTFEIHGRGLGGGGFGGIGGGFGGGEEGSGSDVLSVATLSTTNDPRVADGELTAGEGPGGGSGAGELGGSDGALRGGEGGPGEELTGSRENASHSTAQGESTLGSETLAEDGPSSGGAGGGDALSQGPSGASSGAGTALAGATGGSSSDEQCVGCTTGGSSGNGTATATVGGAGATASAAESGAQLSANSTGRDTSSMASASVGELHVNHQADDATAAPPSNVEVSRAKRGAVPIRRSIQVVVRADHLAILPERSNVSEPTTGGKRIPLAGATEASLDQFVEALKEHIREWGIAGDGLYWRPVLVFNVGPDGEHRAEDLARLLKHSGVELRQSASATRTAGAKPGETR